jgi:Mg-chelatase subunit ChlD/Flp pilus assembly pilin Flp
MNWRNLLQDFRRDQRGATAIMFAFAAVPLVMFAGVAVDYTRASKIKGDLQSAADAAVLAVARNFKSTTDNAVLKREVEEYMAATLPASYDYDVISVTRNNGRLAAHVEGDMPTGISGILGRRALDLSLDAEAAWGTGKLEVMLVLDNTGSMANQGRMTEMKKAAKALLDQLQASDPGLVKVGIVPFDVTVKVPTSYKSASWVKIDWLTSLFWKGCIADRDQSNDVSDATVTTATSTKYPATTCETDRSGWGSSSASSSLATVLPLTSNFTDLNAKVTAMTPAGNTNVTIGVSWGLALLSAQEPFTEGAAWGTADLTKIMVVMTDGENTENRWSTSASAINARTTLACQAAKDAGVVVYTVRLMEGNASLLSGCATSTDTYYDINNLSELVPAFQAIGQELSQLRLAR